MSGSGAGTRHHHRPTLTDERRPPDPCPPRAAGSRRRRVPAHSPSHADALFAANVASRGSEPALVDPANRQALLGTAPRRLTWDELDSEVTALAARLRELGIGRGDVVGVQLPNAIELAEVYLAAWKIGAVVSPLAMQYREREIETMASEAQFDAFITCSTFGGRSHAFARIRGRD